MRVEKQNTQGGGADSAHHVFELNCWSTTGYCSFKIGERCLFVCLLDLDKNGLLCR